MTTKQAREEACRRWTTPAEVPMPGDRQGDARMRSQNGVLTCEVGYEVRGGLHPNGQHSWSKWRAMGRGPSWEAAFTEAESKNLVIANCQHEHTHRGKDAPRRYGSWRTEVCDRCGAFRTHGHDVARSRMSAWRRAREYTEATAEMELD